MSPTFSRVGMVREWNTLSFRKRVASILNTRSLPSGINHCRHGVILIVWDHHGSSVWLFRWGALLPVLTPGCILFCVCGCSYIYNWIRLLATFQKGILLEVLVVDPLPLVQQPSDSAPMEEDVTRIIDAYGGFLYVEKLWSQVNEKVSGDFCVVSTQLGILCTNVELLAKTLVAIFRKDAVRRWQCRHKMEAHNCLKPINVHQYSANYVCFLSKGSPALRIGLTTVILLYQVSDRHTKFLVLIYDFGSVSREEFTISHVVHIHCLVPRIVASAWLYDIGRDGT